MSLVEQELLTLPQHLSSPPVFGGVRVTRSLVLYVCFVDHCVSFCTFSFGHCDVCSSSIYGFWLPLWYLQTLLLPQTYVNLVDFSCSGVLVFLLRKTFRLFGIKWLWAYRMTVIPTMCRLCTNFDIYVFILSLGYIQLHCLFRIQCM